MNIKELEFFMVVYEEQSINKAAKKLFITTQGLSKIIMNLESELNAILFVRSQKGVIPTEGAIFLYGKAKELIQHFEDIKNGIKQIAATKKTLKIACASGVLNALSFSLILGFMNKHPEIDVEWREVSNADVKTMVSSFKADVGLIVGEYDDPRIIRNKICSRQTALLVHNSHHLYNRDIVSLLDIKDEKIVSLNSEHHIYHEFNRHCRNLGFIPNIVAETADSHHLYKLCKMQVGIGVLIDFSTEYFNLTDMKVISIEEQFTWDVFEIIHEQCVNYNYIETFHTYLNEYAKR